MMRLATELITTGAQLMSEENFQKVKSFYIDFVNETLPRLLK